VCYKKVKQQRENMKLELKSFEMIEKVDVLGGLQCILDFGDDVELSIISGTGAYGGDRGLYEIAVLKNGEFAGLPGIVDVEEQVRGYLTEAEIDVIIKTMYLLTGKVPSQV
jgi:hypothetical protein